MLFENKMGWLRRLSAAVVSAIGRDGSGPEPARSDETDAGDPSPARTDAREPEAARQGETSAGEVAEHDATGGEVVEEAVGRLQVESDIQIYSRVRVEFDLLILLAVAWKLILEWSMSSTSRYENRHLKYFCIARVTQCFIFSSVAGLLKLIATKLLN